jgi:peroxiredoxin
MATTAPATVLGMPAPDFTLPSIDGATVSLDDFAASRALLVLFICNHCPFVRHVEHELGAIARDYLDRGLGTVAISSNDVVSHPDDDVINMRAQASRAGFGFPYLYDESQDVARAYGAACTPDAFLFDADRKLAYRGELDGSRPSNGQPVTGAAIRSAIDKVLAGLSVPLPHKPSIGCSIKWRDTG